MGTSVGTKVFLDYGWRANAGLNVAWAGFQLLLLLLRGPHCDRYTWIGYQGGLAWRKKRKVTEEPSSQIEEAEKGVKEAEPVQPTPEK